MLQKLCIRIHPLSKGGKSGHRVQQYYIYGILFREAQGWYVCSFAEAQWEYLRSVRANNENPDSKPVFDICTESERVAMEQRERQAKITEVVPAPVDLTTMDLRSPVEAKDQKRDEKLAAADGVVDLAPPVPGVPGATVKRGRGRPRKVTSATEG